LIQSVVQEWPEAFILRAKGGNSGGSDRERNLSVKVLRLWGLRRITLNLHHYVRRFWITASAPASTTRRTKAFHK